MENYLFAIFVVIAITMIILYIGERQYSKKWKGEALKYRERTMRLELQKSAAITSRYEMCEGYSPMIDMYFFEVYIPCSIEDLPCIIARKFYFPGDNEEERIYAKNCAEELMDALNENIIIGKLLKPHL